MCALRCIQGGAAAAIATIFSPAHFRLFSATEEEDVEATAPNGLADKTTAVDLGEDVRRRVQMTKAFTALREDITSESPHKKASPCTQKPSPRKVKKAGHRKSEGVQRKAITKVKSEPMRRSRRARNYKKGQYSESAMEKLAWSGQGSRASPIIC